MEVVSKNSEPEELEVVEVLKALLTKYDVPMFTQKVIVEKGAIPHSHPVLTLNTRSKDKRVQLKTLVHEQLHWHAQEHPKYAECISYLKTRFKDDGEHNKSGEYPDSYWEHIIVCFNTRKYLEENLSVEDVEWVYNQWQAYPTLEKLIVENKEEVKADLEKFEMVFKGK